MLARSVRCFCGIVCLDLTTFFPIPRVLKMLNLSTPSRQITFTSKGIRIRTSTLSSSENAVVAVRDKDHFGNIDVARRCRRAKWRLRGNRFTGPRLWLVGACGLPKHGFTMAKMARTESLNICFLSCGLVGRQTPDLASWVPDLDKSERAGSFSLMKRLEDLCSAAGKSTPRMNISHTGRMLSAQGGQGSRGLRNNLSKPNIRLTQDHHLPPRLAIPPFVHANLADLDPAHDVGSV